MFIDAHTHRYADYVIKDPAAWGISADETYWVSLTGKGSIQGWASREKMLSDMDAAGVEKAVLLGWYWEHHSTCEEQLDWFLGWISEDPERFIVFTPVQPTAGSKAFDLVKRAIDGGCKGIGEILPQVQGFDLNSDQTWMDICGWAEQNRIPVNLHVTEAAGHVYPGRVDTPLQNYLHFAERFPDLPVIFAHWGGGLPFYFLNRFVKKTLDNVYFDTAASPLNYDSRIWKTVIDLVGAGRVLYGSDYPLRIYPGKQKEADFLLLLEELHNSGITDGQISDITHLNIKKLLNVE